MVRDKTLLDYELAGTPLRGLVLQGPFSLCAYIGVPKDHWLANMPDLKFQCHWGVNFAAEGDGINWPKDWFWYGWDYAHAGDYMDLTKGLEDVPAEILELVNAINADRSFWRPAKKWTLEEVEQDVMDAAMSLMEAMKNAETSLRRISNTAVQKGSS